MRAFKQPAENCSFNKVDNFGMQVFTLWQWKRFFKELTFWLGLLVGPLSVSFSISVTSFPPSRLSIPVSLTSCNFSGLSSSCFSFPAEDSYRSCWLFTFPVCCSFSAKAARSVSSCGSSMIWEVSISVSFSLCCLWKEAKLGLSRYSPPSPWNYSTPH